MEFPIDVIKTAGLIFINAPKTGPLFASIYHPFAVNVITNDSKKP